MVDIDKVRCKIRSMQEITRQVYLQKVKEFEVNSNDISDNLEKHISAYCYASELGGMIKAYEEVLREINLFILVLLIKQNLPNDFVINLDTDSCLSISFGSFIDLN